MVQTGSCFWERLAVFADAPALLDGDGRPVTYRALVAGAEVFAGRLGATRKLVFLEAANTVAALTAYLGCLIGRHPVFLFAGADRDKVGRLIDAYRPNFVVEGGEPQSLRADTLALHPDLRVLLSTSGSTGSVKLVKLSGQALHANAEAIAQYLGLSPSERAITLLSPHYAYGLSVVHSHWCCGASLALTETSVTDAAFWEAFRRDQATSFAGVPYTFETLARMTFDFADLPSFRYATQAGGRLAPALVRRFAKAAAAAGGRFVVMYGQTEAAPRMAYLPPDRAADFPGAIGIPIPGGTITLAGDDGRTVESPDTPGQIVYRGPNIMMGYAQNLADLASDDTPDALFTGDIATRSRDGLLTIVGRAARFVKPFGRRITLDDVELTLRAKGVTAACAGNDDGLVVAVEGTDDGLAPALAAAFDLPPFAVQVVAFATLPRLASGKPDYPAILALQRSAPALPATHDSQTRAGWCQLFTWRFVRRVADESGVILGLKKAHWTSVADIFHQLVGPAGAGDSFTSLGGDSMRYVQVSLALEDFFGSLPPKWEHQTIAELEQMRGYLF